MVFLDEFPSTRVGRMLSLFSLDMIGQHMETSAPRLSTAFVISKHDLEVEACTAAIGIEPTTVWRQRHAHLTDHPDIPNTNWIVEIRHRELDDVNEAVDELLDLIWPRRAEIRAYLHHSGAMASVVCAVHLGNNDERPVYELSAQTIKRLAELECDFSLDIF